MAEGGYVSRQTTIIHFVRHGEVDNVHRLRYGRLPGYHLSAIGRRQVEQTSHFFLGRSISHIYTSPLERTQQTATLLGLALPHVDISLDARLLEVKTPPDLEGKSRAKHFYYPDESTAVAETEEQIVHRLRNFNEEKIIAHNGKEIIAVSHGDPIALLTDHVIHNVYDPYGDPYPAYASIYSFVYCGLELQALWHNAYTDTGAIRS